MPSWERQTVITSPLTPAGNVSIGISEDLVGLAKDTTVQYEPKPKLIDITIPLTNPNIEPLLVPEYSVPVFDANFGLRHPGSGLVEIHIPIANSFVRSSTTFFVGFDVYIPTATVDTNYYNFWILYRDGNNWLRARFWYDATNAVATLSVEENVGGTITTRLSDTFAPDTWTRYIFRLSGLGQGEGITLFVYKGTVNLGGIHSSPTNKALTMIAAYPQATNSGLKNLRIQYIKI